MPTEKFPARLDLDRIISLFKVPFKITIMLKWMRLAKDIYSPAKLWIQSQFTLYGHVIVVQIVWNDLEFPF